LINIKSVITVIKTLTEKLRMKLLITKNDVGKTFDLETFAYAPTAKAYETTPSPIKTKRKYVKRSKVYSSAKGAVAN